MAITRSRRAAFLTAVLCVGTGMGLTIHFWPEKGQDTRYNEETVAIMRRVMTPDANGVDVGAFEGTLTEPMARIAPRGMHYAVEPQPAYARKLRDRFRNVKVLECALSDREGTGSLTLALDHPAYSGFKSQDYPTKTEPTEKISVRIARLDDLIPASTRIAFIKIDVEGAEYLVLCGAKETIRRGPAVIVFEYGRAGIQEFGTKPGMMWALLHEELGLELSLMHTWLGGGQALTAPEFQRLADAGAEWMFVAYPPTVRR